MFKRLLIAAFLLGLALGFVSPAHAAGAPPPCLPNPILPSYAWGAVPITVSTRYDTWGIWVCEHPDGYTTHMWMFKLSDMALYFVKYKVGLISKADADADCATTCVDATPAEDAFATPLKASYYPLALVALNGASFTRPVYTANADGTLNPTPVAGASVSVAARCDEGRRIVGSPYYSVAGLPNVSAPGQVLGAVFTICTVQLPIGSN